MLNKIMFRACTLLLLINLIACVPDDSVVPQLETEAEYAMYDYDASQPPVSGIPIPLGLLLLVEIQASDCLTDGVTLLATNPSQVGSPPYTQSIYSVKWYRKDQLIATGAQLTECICDEKITVKVENINNGATGSTTYIAKPCKAQATTEKH